MFGLKRSWACEGHTMRTCRVKQATHFVQQTPYKVPHATCTIHRATDTVQRTPCNRQSTTCNRQRTPCNRQHTPCNRQRTSCNRHRAAYIVHRTTYTVQRTKCRRCLGPMRSGWVGLLPCPIHSRCRSATPRASPMSTPFQCSYRGEPGPGADVGRRVSPVPAPMWASTPS